MTHPANRPSNAILPIATALLLGLCNAAAWADDFKVTIRVPVNFNHLSPKVTGLFLSCAMFDVHGKNLSPYGTNGDWSMPDIDPNVRSYKGVLTQTITFNQDQALKIDWGSYQCDIQFAGQELSSNYPSIGNASEPMRLLPGAVVQVKGSLF
nr:hypothetical protein [Rhodoferax sp.]